MTEKYSTLPRLMLISDQVMLKAANQVLYQTVRGFLENGFVVNLVLDGNTGHEAKNIANVYDLFPDYLDRLKVSYYYARFNAVFSLLKKVKSEFSKFRKPSDVKSQAHVFLDSDTIGGFDKTRTELTFVSDLKFSLKWQAALRIAELEAANRKPDIICGFEIGGAVPAEKLAKMLGVPLFTKYMGTIVYPYIVENRIDKIKPYVKGLSVNADLHFMLNDGTKGDEVLYHFGIPKEKIRFRIDGIDKSKFKSVMAREQAVKHLKLPLVKDDFVCLCLSNHNSGYKRLDRAVRAISVVAQKNKNFKLILVGNGANTNNLKSLAEALKCTENVIFMPKIEHNDIPNILSVANIYLNTNDQSNLSHPVLEAMISGKTVVTMDDGSLDGIIRNNINGILINPKRTSVDLPNVLLELSHDPSRIEDLGEKAKTFAQENFLTWDEKNQLEIDEVKELLKSFNNSYLQIQKAI